MTENQTGTIETQCPDCGHQGIEYETREKGVIFVCPGCGKLETMTEATD